MPRINYSLLVKLPEEKRDFLGFRPDILLFQDDESEYQATIHKLTAAKYLYTDGFDIRPASLLRYVFESFKGWLGLDNNCEPRKVQMGLRKYAFYGYLQGYSQTHSNSLQRHGVPAIFFHLLHSPRGDDTTKALQDNLTRFYVSDVQHLVAKEGEPSISFENHSFGKTWASLELWSEIPKLDPQDDSLITTTVEHLENSRTSYTFLKNSKYAFSVAQIYMNEVRAHQNTNRFKKYLKSFLNFSTDAQALIEKAIFYAPDICLQNKNIFINFYLEKKNFDAAFHLIEQLQDLKEAITLLNNHFEKSKLLQYVKKDSPLGIALSKQFITENTTKLEDIRFAAQFNSNLGADFPAQGLRLLVADQQYDAAYTLYSNAQKGSEFYSDDLEKLADYFTERSSVTESTALQFATQKNWKAVMELMPEGIQFTEKAISLDDNGRRTQRLNIQRLLYARALIENDNTRSISDCNIKQVNQAVELLKQCSFSANRDKENYKLALAKGLMRQVDYKIKAILPTEYEAKHQFIAFTKAHYAEIQEIVTLLREIIELLKNTDNQQLKFYLGKANFILADITLFFSLSDENMNHFYIAAMKAVPTNPIYTLICSELTEDKDKKEDLQAEGVGLLKDLGYSTLDYYRWSEHRWHKDKISEATQLVDPHNFDNPEKSGKTRARFSII
ncbi:hypothetical protein [Legionella hackeliae]|uniref:Uncharacterized protein n=1 Tax=Legionella hackeliae TaxID=449 RepID=A0A0A8UN08_LEGHA|nr:hypothetical protein [Legionella hackeliae]CEK10265.1 protein of unknown function [Legionella hackeliae]STX46994.1 Uncharacterised protein [Legionella hackeliae]